MRCSRVSLARTMEMNMQPRITRREAGGDQPTVARVLSEFRENCANEMKMLRAIALGQKNTASHFYG